MEPERETFGERFGRLVDQHGLSVREVCQIVGWKSDSSYYKARRGDLGSMNPLGLLRLAKRLKVSPYYLALESPDEETPEDQFYKNIPTDERAEHRERSASFLKQRGHDGEKGSRSKLPPDGVPLDVDLQDLLEQILAQLGAFREVFARLSADTGLSEDSRHALRSLASDRRTA